MKRRRMMMSNLPQDLVKEILSRVPLASLKAVRSTCKKWNALTKDQSFTNKHIGNVAATSGEREFLIMIMDYKVYLIGFNLHGIQNNDVDLSIKLKGKLNSIECSHKVSHKSQVFHCNGLFLFVFNTSFVVWNPYCGIPKYIKRPYKERGRFALGYDKSCGSHKILRLYGNNLKLYDLSSGSWTVPNVTLKWDISSITHFGSLKGNSYWYANDEESFDYFIFSFDFTRKRFGPRLDVPFNGHRVSLSVVKDEQLAMLFKRRNTYEMEIWVTNKIEPDAISWSRFLKFNMTPNDLHNVLPKKNLHNVDFLIDEEKKVAVVFDRVRAKSRKLELGTYTNIACIIGENNYLRRVDLGESLNISYCRLACSYVPSSVQIN